MHRQWISFWVGLCLLLAISFAPDATVIARTSRASASDVIEAVNSLRTAHGLPAYSVNSILMGTAQGQADYMASIGAATHTGPGGSTVTQRLLAAGYPLAGDLSLGGFRSENVVMGSGMTPAGAVSLWTGDSLHLHTMLSADLQEIGAGVSEKDGMVYYVIDCARPTSSGVPQAYTPGAEGQLSGADDVIVPVVVSTPNEEGDIIHEVKAGQTLWQIAITYGVKINDIRQLNNLGSTLIINPGDKLLIRRQGTATAAPPTATDMPVQPTSTEFATVVMFATTATDTSTPVLVAPIPPSAGAGAAVGAIALVALLAAGLVAWAGRSRAV